MTVVGGSTDHLIVDRLGNVQADAVLEVRTLAGVTVTDVTAPTGWTGQAFPAGKARADGDGYFKFVVPDATGPVQVRTAAHTEGTKEFAAGPWLDVSGQVVPGSEVDQRLAAMATDADIDAKVAAQAAVDSATYARITAVTERALSVAAFGTLGSGDDTATIQAAFDASSGRTLVFPGGASLKAKNVILSNKTGTRIDGNGATIELLSTGARVGVELGGVLEDVHVTGLRVKGTGVLADRHAGIYAQSGGTYTAVEVAGCRIQDVTLGISFSANGSGLIDGVNIHHNDIDNVVGTDSGNGYGLHHASSSALPANVKFIGNTVRRAQRHSIYQAMGTGVTIQGNHLLSHRSVGADGSVRAALTVLRSSAVDILGNYVSGARDGSMNIACDTGVAETINAIGNLLTAPADDIPLLCIGDSLLTSSPRDVNLVGNLLSTTSLSRLIRIFCAIDLYVASNKLRLSNATGGSAIEIRADGDAGGTANLTDDLAFVGNKIKMLGGGTTHRAFRLAGAETSIAAMLFRGNVIKGAATEFITSAATTNPNITVAEQGYSGLALAAGTRLVPAPLAPLGFIPNSVAPTGTPVGGGYFFTEAGALKYKGSSGTVTTIGPA